MGQIRRGRDAIAALLVLSVAAFGATVFLRPNPGCYNAWFDVGLYNVPFGLAAVACWWRSSGGGTDRGAWRLLAFGFLVFVAGNVYGSVIVGNKPIYPSPADAMWLGFYLIVYIAIVRMAMARLTRFLPSTWLDGAVAGFGAAALVVTFALAPVLTQTDGTFSVVATNLAYPTVEILLVIVLMTVGFAVRARDASWWLLALGLSLLAAGDIVYLFEEASGTYREGGLLDISWPLAVSIVGLAACARSPVTRSQSSVTGQLVIPALFASTSLGLLVYGQTNPVAPVGVALAAGSLAVAFVRTGLTVRDVTALANSRREARTDQLTGLANRRGLLEHLQAAMGPDGRAASLLIIDLDQFKEVNDSLGHTIGDTILRAVGERLSPLIGEPALLGRLGGDEFAVVAPGLSRRASEELARTLREALAEDFDAGEVQIRVDASAGVASCPDDGTTPDALMSNADVAMYRAKRLRTGVEAFDATLDRVGPGRLELLRDLRAALDEPQLQMHYQPQLDLRTGTVTAVEALVRWKHPRRGTIAPDDFLPLAERANLMTRLTDFVLRQALTDCARLRRAGFPLAVSINVSPADLIDGMLPVLVDERLAQLDVPPEMLVIEVTEGTIMADRVRSLAVLRRLRDSGVCISVDDYGTGQASLAYLRELPLGELKLDRSFLQGVPDDARNCAIVRSTIDLAHAFDLPIVAEGVEDARALEWLRQLGCDMGQGFHIARPLPLPELLAWLQAHDAAGPGESPLGNRLASAELLLEPAAHTGE